MLLHRPLYFFPFLQRQACLKICLYELISSSLLYASVHYSSNSALITLLKVLKITHILVKYIIGRTDTDAEALTLWPPDAKSWLIRKDPDAGQDWRQEEKGVTEDEMVGWYHWLNGNELEQALGDGEGQGSLACFSASGHKELDTTEPLNSNSVFSSSEWKTIY